jgi:quinoprotein glucose dehydrogenase
VSALVIYRGNEFKEWNGDALITSLKDKSLRKIKFKKNNFINEKIVFKGNIGRIRDIKIHKNTGQIYMLSDRGELWRMYK